MKIDKLKETHQKCSHCGDALLTDYIQESTNVFCCHGCKLVFEILSSNGLGAYYDYNDRPGTKVINEGESDFSYLDANEISSRLCEFEEGDTYRISFDLPQIHCSSCLWLLENLTKLNKGISSSIVSFSQKKCTIIADRNEIKLSELVSLLHSIGYPPRLNLSSLDDSNKKSKYDKRLLYQIGLSGFAFGNIMLLSFPEYLGFENSTRLHFLAYINIFLAIPVLLFSAIDYLKSAWYSAKNRQLNLDVPIALGILVLFGRSAFDIIFGIGEGYLDSFSGFVFFLLIGKWFQSMTYQVLDFDREYTSYFPISVSVKKGDQYSAKSLTDVEEGEILLIRNQDIIPCDSKLIRGNAKIDYSFVTGESKLIDKNVDDLLYAGGKNAGNSIEVEVKRKISDSYLTQLWREKAFVGENHSTIKKLVGHISKYFSYSILGIAIISLTYWSFIDTWLAMDVFISVLIVACPCALALAIPFTYGTVVRILAKNGLFLRNVDTIENIQDIDEIIFDKTGTLTDTASIQVEYHGLVLSDELKGVIKSSCSHSLHPLSKAIYHYYSDAPFIQVDVFENKIGDGFMSIVGNNLLRLGSASYVLGSNIFDSQSVHIEMNNQYLGEFRFNHCLREGIEEVLYELANAYPISLLSGDSDTERKRFSALFFEDKMHFKMSPKDKLKFIETRQARGNKILMIGDGLNDAGALKQANVGIAITEEGTNFSPSCDGMLSADKTKQLGDLIEFTKKAKNLVYVSFCLAFLYNIIGLFFAISGNLKPVVAAVLMPLSSISIIVFGVLGSYTLSHFYLSKNNNQNG